MTKTMTNNDTHRLALQKFQQKDHQVSRGPKHPKMEEKEDKGK